MGNALMRMERIAPINAIQKVPLFVQSRTFSFLSMGSFGVRRGGTSPEGGGSGGERRSS